MAGRGGDREHAARFRMAAAAPARRPAAAGRGFRRFRGSRGSWGSWERVAVTLNGRMTVTAAVAVVLSSTVLYPVFTDSLWFAASLGAVTTVAVAGALTRLRSLPVVVCLAASIAALVLYLNLVFEARHSWLAVIPTPGSISR